jgi:hypothetical protein
METNASHGKRLCGFVTRRPSSHARNWPLSRPSGTNPGDQCVAERCRQERKSMRPSLCSKFKNGSERTRKDS